MAKKPTQLGPVGEGFDEVIDTIVAEQDTGFSYDNSHVKQLFSTFEKQKRTDGEIEYWYARDIQLLLSYKRWEDFKKVIEKARAACENSRIDSDDHFRYVPKMVSIGSKAERNIEDVALTRYACYLIAQNGDPRKIEIAFAQTYFATQTRKLELIEQTLKDMERVEARHKLQETERHLSGVVYQRGFANKDFGIMRSKGDQALFGGRSTQTMKARLDVPKSRPLADFTDTVIIKGKDFAAAMTAFNTEANDLYGVTQITNEHVLNNESVRQALLSRCIYPERLPKREDIRKVERKLRSQEVEPPSENEAIGKISESVEKEFELYIIDVSKDLWKIALLIMATKLGGIVTTKELIEEIPNYIEIPDTAYEDSDTRKEPRYYQIVRNLKSNKKNRTSVFARGYANDIRGGFQITQAGLDFVKETFKDFV